MYSFQNIDNPNEKMDELFQQPFEKLFNEGILKRDDKTGQVLYESDGKTWVMTVSGVGRPKLIGSGFFENDY